MRVTVREMALRHAPAIKKDKRAVGAFVPAPAPPTRLGVPEIAFTPSRQSLRQNGQSRRPAQIPSIACQIEGSRFTGR